MRALIFTRPVAIFIAY